MVIFGVPAVVTFCSGAFIPGWARILGNVWALLELQSSSLRTGIVDGQLFLGNTEECALHTLKPFLFLTFKYSLGTDVLNSAPFVP